MASRIRWLLGAAVLVPILYFGNLLVSGWLYPGYSHFTQQPSDLGAAGTLHPAVFNGGIILTGIMSMLGSFGLAGAARFFGGGRIVTTLLGALLLMCSAYLILIGIFSLPDPRHYSVSPLALSIHIAPFLLAAALWRRQETHGLAVYLVVTGMVMLGMLAVVLGAGSLVTRSNGGLFTRLYALAVFPWIGVAGYVLRSVLREA